MIIYRCNYGSQGGSPCIVPLAAKKMTDGTKYCTECGAALDAAPASVIRPAPSTAALPQANGWFRRNPKRAVLAGIVLVLLIGLLASGLSRKENEAAVRQWMVAVGPFYQEYGKIETEFEVINQGRRTTHPEMIKAWTQLVQNLRGMQGQLNKLQPLPNAAKEDAADMTQIQKLWSELLTVELQMAQQLLQYSQQGQKPPAEFLQGTLPGLWQTKNKLFQDQQQLLTRMAARNRINAFSP